MKKLFVIIFALTLSGCTMDYDITFSKNSTVNDKLLIRERVMNFMEVEPLEWSQILEESTSKIDVIDELFEEKAIYNILLSKQYNSLNSYFNSNLFKKYIGKYEYTEGDMCISKIIFNEVFKDNMYGTDIMNPSIESLKIKMKFPFKVIESNATSTSGNTYIWELTNDNKLDNMYIKYRNQKNVKKTDDMISIIFITTLFVLVIGFIINIILKYKKNNDL